MLIKIKLHSLILIIHQAFFHGHLCSFSYRSSKSHEAISNYVKHVFVMAPGVLSLVGFLLVLCLQPSVLACKAKGERSICIT